MRGAVSDIVAADAQPVLHAAWLPAAHTARQAAADDDEPLLASSERAALNGSEWFAALPMSVRHDLLRRCRVRRYREGEPLHGGLRGIGLDAVASGAVAIAMRESPELAFDYLPAGTWLVDPALFAGGERRHVVVAHAGTSIVSIGSDALAEAMGRHFGLEQALLGLSHGLLASQCEILSELSGPDLRTRLARCLRRLAARFGEPEPRGVRIALELKQDALATLVRGCRARVNLHLKALERASVLVVERQIVVRDERALASHC
ncbi:Crp/Fnr family transcriptional regulator [Ramlibacter albus]|uniref:Crp/Fnr family transcriptional regulator n=1 Tax=Ramlibacter albus TaxID=2079448 RepID=A0A923S3B5_9BURK|nr:Crp/Fnr family transcriptional regulator [Ramlibacter albus]MBC5765668.1 Crp/Fnr family transcriptional regulator [Ramlibacter albus]